MMCRGVEEVNKKLSDLGEDPQNIASGSMDAVGLYPSLKVAETVSIVKEMVGKSYIDFSDVDWQELAKYLRSRTGES